MQRATQGLARRSLADPSNQVATRGMSFTLPFLRQLDLSWMQAGPLLNSPQSRLVPRRISRGDKAAVYGTAYPYTLLQWPAGQRMLQYGDTDVITREQQYSSVAARGSCHGGWQQHY